MEFWGHQKLLGVTVYFKSSTTKSSFIVYCNCCLKKCMQAQVSTNTRRTFAGRRNRNIEGQIWCCCKFIWFKSKITRLFFRLSTLRRSRENKRKILSLQSYFLWVICCKTKLLGLVYEFKSKKPLLQSKKSLISSPKRSKIYSKTNRKSHDREKHYSLQEGAFFIKF